MLGLLKIILIIWIASTVYRWYKRVTAGRERQNPAAEPMKPENPGTVHSGRIEDAEFEEMDNGPDQSR